MNRHLKLAIVIAPFLAIGGFGLAEIYTRKITQDMAAPSQTRCKLKAMPCQLKHGKLALNLSLQRDETQSLIGVKLNSNQPLTGLFIGWVSHNQTEHSPMPMTSLTQQDWVLKNNKDLTKDLRQRKPLILRIAANQSGKYYISEVIIRF